MGRAFGWNRIPMRVEDSLVARLSESDRRESEIAPGTTDSVALRARPTLAWRAAKPAD